ncbi:MAG: Nif3-like dinuclear metal center hexameric protein [Bacteroidota bacterium]
MGIPAKDIIHSIESWAPPTVAESYDNPGLLVGLPDQKVTGILINLDATMPVVEEAIAKDCNMIIAHHPIWFTGRRRLNGEDYVSRTIMAAVKHDILLYACHTNLDNVRTGVNHMIAQKLGLEKVEFLQAKNPEQTIGSGMIGSLPEPISKADFLKKVATTFQAKGIRYADSPHSHIQKVAICGGAGSFLTQEARKQGADAFVTADITYHKFFDNEGEMLLLDIGHYESEQYTSELIHTYLSEKFPNFAIHLSDVHTNPVKYFSS